MINPFLDKKRLLERPVLFEMLVTTPTTPTFSVVTGGALTIDDNLDGTYLVHSSDPITRIKFLDVTATIIEVIKGATLTSTFELSVSNLSLTDFIWNGECNLVNMENMFASCTSLNNVPLFDTSSVTNWRGVFYNCSSLAVFPLFDTSSGTDFRYCFSLTAIINVPLFVLSGSSSIGCGYMFQDCNGIINFPAIDFSNSNRIYSLLRNCSNLETCSFINTQNCLEIMNVFQNCVKLTCIAELDTTTATNKASMFANTPLLTSPTALEQTDLADVDGAVYVNGSPCP